LKKCGGEFDAKRIMGLKGKLGGGGGRRKNMSGKRSNHPIALISSWKQDRRWIKLEVSI